MLVFFDNEKALENKTESLQRWVMEISDCE